MINFTGGPLYYNGQYISPHYIGKFEETHDAEGNKCLEVKYIDGTSDYLYVSAATLAVGISQAHKEKSDPLYVLA